MTDIIIIATTFGIALFYTIIRLWMLFQHKMWIEQYIIDKLLANAEYIRMSAAFMSLAKAAQDTASSIQRFGEALAKVKANDETKNQS